MPAVEVGVGAHDECSVERQRGEARLRDAGVVARRRGAFTAAPGAPPPGAPSDDHGLGAVPLDGDSYEPVKLDPMAEAKAIRRHRLVECDDRRQQMEDELSREWDE